MQTPQGDSQSLGSEDMSEDEILDVLLGTRAERDQVASLGSAPPGDPPVEAASPWDTVVSATDHGVGASGTTITKRPRLWYWPIVALLVAALAVFALKPHWFIPESRLLQTVPEDDTSDDEQSERETSSPTKQTRIGVRFNYSRIEAGLYLGGYVPEPPPETGAVLNLCQLEDPYTAGVHRWRPIPDAAPAPSLDWLREQVEFVNEQRRAGLTVFVHCHAGISRGCMVVSAYLMVEHHWSRDEAIEFIRGNRPIVAPNPAFMRLLLEWQGEPK